MKALPDLPRPQNNPQPDTDPLTFDGQPRCTANSRQTGKRCQRAATPGTHVCKNHGSQLPVVKRAAQLRLLSLTAPAIATLAREMEDGDKSADRVRAANSVLDRVPGFGRQQVVTDVDVARDLLLERLKELRDQVSGVTVVDGVVDAELVDEE